MENTTTRYARPWKPYWTPIDQRRRHLKDLGRRLETPQEFHVLGAGVAGLAAAIEILELPLPGGQRHRVTIHEGSGRVGGRIDTKRLGRPPAHGQPDLRPYFERGAMRIPTSHDYTWAYAREANLKRRRFLNTDRSHDFRRSGQVYRPPQLGKLEADYALLASDRGKGPGPLYQDLVLEPELALLDQAYGGQDRWAPRILDGRIDGEALRRVDQLSLDQVLAQRVGTRGKLANFLRDLLFAGLSDRSFLMFVRSWLVNRGTTYELCRDHGGGTVEGGMEMLVQEMKARIDRIDPNIVQCHRPVTGIHVLGDDWTVRFRNGSTIRRAGNPRRHLLCTLPFSILRDREHFQLGGFSTDKMAAIEGLSYAHAAKVTLHVDQRFWQDRPYGIKGGRSLDDRRIRATYYPNDDHPPEPIQPLGPDAHAAYDLYTQPPETQSGDEIAALAAAPPRPGPWLMLSSYTFGEHARRMGPRPPAATVPDLLRVFPNLESHLVRENAASETWYWNEKEWAKGPFALPTPGNVGRFYQTARRPEGGVFFAGDHLSPEPGWIQGSLFSALWSLRHMLAGAVARTSEGDGS